MAYIESAATIMGAVLTLLALSYLLFGDTFIYRLVLHIFIGALVGYSFSIIIRDILIRMTLSQLQDHKILLVPLAIGVWLLLFKGIPRLAYVGNFALAYLIGVGTAVALGGALLGTLIPQVEATVHAIELKPGGPFTLVDGFLVVGGTICTLMAFNFAAPERWGLAKGWSYIVGGLASVGRVFLIFALGVSFAGALTASLSILIGRIEYIITPVVELYSNLTGS